MLMFEREKSIKAHRNDNSVKIDAHFKDKFHDIEVSMVFSLESKTILSARVQMNTVPFDICHEVCDSLNGLVGLIIKKGIGKKIQEIIGKSNGCAHLFDIVMDILKVLTQVDFCLLPEEMSFDEKIEHLKTVNKGICHTYSNLERNPEYIGVREL